MMKKNVLWIVLFLQVFQVRDTNAKSKKKQVYARILYYKNTFGHIHRNPSRYSSSLTTIGCAHPLKKLKAKTKLKVDSKWTYVGGGPYKGYVLSEFLAQKRVKCFSDAHSLFFDKMNLSITDMYYFGRLYDQYVIGTTRRP